MAMGVLILHWILLFGYGLAFNDQGGYRYCRVAMPSLSLSELTPWVLTIAGLIGLTVLGLVDRKYFKMNERIAFLPVVLFAVTQFVAIWMVETSVRY